MNNFEIKKSIKNIMFVYQINICGYLKKIIVKLTYKNKHEIEIIYYSQYKKF